MRKFLLLSLSLVLLIMAGCTRKVVIVKTQPSEAKKAIIVHPTKTEIASSENHLRQAKKFYYNGKYKQARKHCEKAIKFNHSNWEAHYYLGLTMQKKREYAVAVEALGVSLKYSPENRLVRSELHLAIGYSWEKLGNAKKAGTEYSLAIQYNPENQEAIEARNRMKVDKTMKNWGHKKKTRL